MYCFYLNKKSYVCIYNTACSKNGEQYKINIKHSEYMAALRTRPGCQQIDFASSHKWFVKSVTNNL